jgi:glycosyltransferase involved in cell wall biosynthesis
MIDMNDRNREKILIIAAACHPDKGSEPGVGYTWVKAISNHYNIDVICGEKEGNREAILRELKLDKALASRVNFHFIPRDVFSSFEKIIINFFYPYYYYRYKQWMRIAYKKAVELSTLNDYILSHQLNMIGYREPGFLWKLDLPFVWGPVGGNGNIPVSFLRCIDSLGAVKQGLRILVNNYQIRFNSDVQHAIKKCASLITVNSLNRDAFKEIYGKDSKIIIISPTTASHKLAEVKINDGGVVRFVCSGLLISRKNLPVVLNALSKVESNHWSLDVLGDGPLFDKWKKLAISLKINDNITWHGQLSKDAAIDVMSCCDVLLFPSLFEGAPGVVSEALSLGLPVVSMDKDGQRDILNGDCGILIPVVNPHEAVLNFTKAISKLLNDPVELERLSNGALKQACKFTIDAQMKIILDAYNKATSS